MKKTLLLFLIFTSVNLSYGQAVPSSEENIPYIVTFGKDSDTSWGDDDFTQIFYFKIEKNYDKPFYLRIFDPGCNGEIDEAKGEFSSVFKFSVYGGDKCLDDSRTNKGSKDNRKVQDSEKNANVGDLLASKIFTPKKEYDNDWYTFGPFNPSDGKLSERHDGYIIKLVCQGIKGDDGNLYKYFMSTSAEENIALEGGNAFTFEYSFRLHAKSSERSHLYPYIDSLVEYVQQINFDWDNDGRIQITSLLEYGRAMETSGDDEEVSSDYTIRDGERDSTLDIQLVKSFTKLIDNNNVVFKIVDQYGEAMPFYANPLGAHRPPKSESSVEGVERGEE